MTHSEFEKLKSTGDGDMPVYYKTTRYWYTARLSDIEIESYQEPDEEVYLIDRRDWFIFPLYDFTVTEDEIALDKLTNGRIIKNLGETEKMVWPEGNLFANGVHKDGPSV